MPKINTTVALTTLKLSSPSWPKYLRTSSITKRESNTAIVWEHASGHLRLLSCIGNHRTGNFHMQSNQYTCTGSWQVQQGKFFNLHKQQVCTTNTEDPKVLCFYGPLEGCYQPLEILISLIWGMYISQVKPGKNKAMQNYCSFRGVESLAHSPKATGLSKIYDLSYSSKGRLFSLPSTAGVAFQLVSQDYLGTINKQDLICANPNTAVHYWKSCSLETVFLFSGAHGWPRTGTHACTANLSLLETDALLSILHRSFRNNPHTSMPSPITSCWKTGLQIPPDGMTTVWKLSHCQPHPEQTAETISFPQTFCTLNYCELKVRTG